MKNDKYKQARGGWSRMLDISCARCGQHVCFYQKDGAGILKRMYIDRMSDVLARKDELACTNCKEVLGTQVIYKKESRPAYRLFVGAVSKKIVKASLHE